MRKNTLISYGKEKIVEGSILKLESGQLRLVLAPTCLSGNIKDVMGGSFYNLLNKRWPSVISSYKEWFVTHRDFKLGSIYTTSVQTDVWVIHLLCIDKNNNLDKKAFEECLKKVNKMCKYEKGSIHVSSMVVDFVPEIKDKLKTDFIEQGISTYYYVEPEVS